jgi:hypothetical protein
MAGHARYTALLDACVLYPLAMTDALMSLATAGFFAAKWTTRIELPDPNDVHVLAAAIAGHADCIVTSNLKDFPTLILMEFGIEAVDPDTFIINQWDLDPVNAIAAFKRMRARRKKPQSSPEDFAFALEQGGLPTTAERLRLAAELI